MGNIVRHVFPHLLTDWGYLAVLLAVLADSFGLPVPGELMVLVAAVYSGATHHLALPTVIGSAAAGAILGDNLTFAIARHGGYPLLRRYGGRLHFGPQRLQIGQYVFRRFGRIVVPVGRLIPVVHIWTALLAGLNRMSWLEFALANAAGAVVWAGALGLAGYALGRTAVKFGGILVGVGLPAAIALAVCVVVLLRINERRLTEAARRASQPGGDLSREERRS